MSPSTNSEPCTERSRQENDQRTAPSKRHAPPATHRIRGTSPDSHPVGPDQDPHIRIARDMAKRIKTQAFIPISSTYNTFLPGLPGGKMSASDPLSHIAITDTPAQIKNKINKYAFSGGQATIEEHRRIGGNPDVDVCYHYLRFFLDNDAELKKIHDTYHSGTLLTGELKKITIETLSAFLTEHQHKRDAAHKTLQKHFPNT
ncbi:MAG: hypothetical protein HC945_03695 [Nitrosarchaeum sp.]|nr:hypothetical protein [Nitrosarchaeum sp.]